MKHKWSVVFTLVLAELALCAGMYSIVQATVATVSKISATHAAFAEALEEQRLAVQAPATLTVDNSYGDVRIVAGTNDAITISAHKQVWGATASDAQTVLAGIDLHATQNGNAIELQPVLPSPTKLSLDVIHPIVDITITVPMKTAVIGHVLFGRISLSGTSGDAELRTGGDSIRVNDVKGNLKLQTDRGDITAEHVRGQIQITSSAGAIHLADVRAEGELTAKSVSGDILLQDCAAGSLNLQTQHGMLSYTGSLGPGPHQLESGSGDIRLSLPKDSTLLLDLQALHGMINSQFPITMTQGDNTRSWRGTINGGGSSLTAVTRTGDIVLERRSQ